MEKNEKGNHNYHNEEEKDNEYKPHCLLVPYPAQGHINPILQFSKRLEAKGVKTTIAITNFISTTLHHLSSTHFSIETISDGFDEGGYSQAPNFQVYSETFRQVGSQTLAQLLRRLRLQCRPVTCVVYDSFLPWALDAAAEEAAMSACFFTQPCAVDCVYYYAYKGLVQAPLAENQGIEIPGLPLLKPEDVPSFLSAPDTFPSVLEMLVNQFSNVEKADWIFVNTVYELEREIIDWMRKLWEVRTIGPTIPSMYLDNRLPEDTEYGLTMFKPMTEICMKWLHTQQENSVIYVSFGSLATLKGEQMEELAWGLWKSNKPFLWVVRSTEEANKLPKNLVEIAMEEGRGLVVTWCPQLQVLAHNSVGCFVTHCGWNSTLEAISLGVPMVAMPQWSDQTTNAKLVADAWKIGVRVKVDEKGVVRREEIEECIRRVMGEEEMRGNVKKWKQVCREAVEEGGSSDCNIQHFFSSLVAKSISN